MTKDYWAHTHAAADSCPGPGLDGLWPALANTSAASFRLSADNGTYVAQGHNWQREGPDGEEARERASSHASWGSRAQQIAYCCSHAESEGNR